MRKRRIRNNKKTRQNLDSFLDILTNTVGVLMFIGLFISLLAVEAGTIIRTPLRSETIKAGKFFEVRNNQIFDLNDSQLEYERERILVTLPKCLQPNIPENIPSYLYSFYIKEIEEYDQCIRARNVKFENFYYDNGNYIVTFTEQGSLKYEVNPLSKGDTTKDLRNSESQFNQILKKLNPRTNYIAFVVRPDSFEAFRVARQKAWNLGYEVGWEPFPQDRVLVFGSGGRSIGVQ